jgi:hypothetical protein
MAVSYNTSLVRNGLVLYLDAANKKSYSGTGTSWIDLSGNSNNATLENGAGYNANNNGTMSFDAIDDYANITNSSIGNFGTSNFSVNCWFKASSGSSGTRGVFSKYDPHSGPGTGWFIFAIDGTIWVRITQDLVDPKEYSEISVNVPTNSWYNVCIVRNGTDFLLYINGNLRQQTVTNNLINCSSVAPLRIGSGYASGYFFQGNVGPSSIYNRALSAIEINKNFEAVRGRYNV